MRRISVEIGQQVLEHVETSLPGIRLLEVEPAEDELTTRRVAFYRRNGYRIVDRSYVQPSYENFGDAAPLWIMGNDRPNGCPNLSNGLKKRCTATRWRADPPIRPDRAGFPYVIRARFFFRCPGRRKPFFSVAGIKKRPPAEDVFRVIGESLRISSLRSARIRGWSFCSVPRCRR